MKEFTLIRGDCLKALRRMPDASVDFVFTVIPQADQHPTEKPVALAEHFIKLHTKPGDVVLDPFMGHGTTGVACARLGRRFIGIELDRQFYLVASKRIARAYRSELAVAA